MPCVISKPGMKLENVRFFRGDREIIAKQDFLKEVSDSEARIASGEIKAGMPPKCKKAAIDLKKFVANL